MMTLSERQERALRFIAQFNGVLASDIGLHLRSDATGRSAASTGAQIAWELIRKRFAERRLVKRELYSYHITNFGREFLKSREVAP